MNENERKDGKEVVIVTGGSRGIGRAIVLAVANVSRIVVFTYNKNPRAAKAVSAELYEKGFEHEFVKLDVADSASATECVEKIGAKYGRIDCLVNNAGLVRDNALYLIEDRDWLDVINVNLSGVFHMCRAVSRYMILRRAGRIVNLSSIVASRGGRGQVNYAAAKAGVEAMTRALAAELARKNVRVNCVAPGCIGTDMTSEVRERHEELIKSRILMGRLGAPEEIANVVEFLLGDGASYITGQTIHVDGGMF
jgi:3-oxoacyl-[acyl-carrier protein] reductase